MRGGTILVAILALIFQFISTNAQFSPVYNSTSYRGYLSGAPQFVAVNGTNFPPADDAITLIPIGFTFVYYNRTYEYLRSSTNGNIQFETNLTTYSTPLFDGSSVGDRMSPVIAAFFTDLYPSTLGQRMWFLTGESPLRRLTIRFVDVNYCCTPYQPGIGLTMDIVLSETSNNIDFIYYRLPPPAARTVQIGLRNNNSSDWVSYWNAPLSNATFAGSMITFSPTNQAPFGVNDMIKANSTSSFYNMSVSSAGYTPMSSLATVMPIISPIPIGFTFPFFNRPYGHANIYGNGQIRLTAAGEEPAAAAETYYIAAFDSTLVFTSGDVMYKSSGAYPSRQLTIRYNAASKNPPGLGTGLTMDVILCENGTIELRYYVLPLRVQNPVGDVATIGLVYPDDNTQSDLAWDNRPFSLQAVNGFSNKVIRFTPTNQSPAPSPPVYNSPSYSSVVTPAPAFVPVAGTPLPGGDDTVQLVPIGFTFVFYNRSYAFLRSGCNGNIQFETQSPSHDSPLQLFGTSTTYQKVTPIIAAYFTDLFPVNATSRISFTTGTAPYRQLTIRYIDVNICCIYPQPNVGLTMDITLSETNNTVQITYYRLSFPLTSFKPIQIGLQNSNQDDWVSYFSATEMTARDYAAFGGQAITFVPVNQVPGGVNTIIPVNTSSIFYSLTVTGTADMTAIDGMQLIPANGVLSVDIGFPFKFFNQSYNKLVFDTHNKLTWGMIQFSNNGSTVTATGIAAFNNGWVAPSSGQTTYITTGTAPNRQCIVRFNNLTYDRLLPTALVMDVILYETTNVIDMRFYSLPIVLADPYGALTKVGLQHPSDLGQSVLVWNQTFELQAANGFSNKQVRYNPPPTPVSSSSSSSSSSGMPSARPNPGLSSSSSSPMSSSSSSSSSTGTNPIPDEAKHEGLSTGTKAGIAIAAMIAFVLFIAGIRHLNQKTKPSNHIDDIDMQPSYRALEERT